MISWVIFWVILVLLTAEAAIAAPVAKRMGRTRVLLSLKTMLAFAIVAAVIAAGSVGLNLDLEHHALIIWGGACLGAIAVSYVVAARAGILPFAEILAAMVLVLELFALVAAQTWGKEALSPSSPGFRSIIVAPPALALCAYFGASLGYLASRTAGRDLRLGYESFIARRFLLSKGSPVLSTVTTISVIGVALGVWLIIVSLGILAGFERDLERKIIGANAHVVVQADRSVPFAPAPDMLRDLAAVPGVTAVNPIIEGEVAVSSQSNYIGALLFGIDPTAAPEVLSVLKPLAAGATPSERDPQDRGSLAPLVRELGPPAAPKNRDEEEQEGEFKKPAPLAKIVIGVEMAKGLNVTVGDTVRVISPVVETMTPLGPAPKSVGFEVAGIFASKMYEFDARYAFVTLPAARRFLELGDDEITGVQLATVAPDKAEQVAQEIGKKLGQGFEALDWRRRNQTLFSALKLERVVAFIVLTFIILVAAFSIVNTLTMAVIEKRKEIAILKTMGARDGGIMKLFLTQGLIVGAFGTLIGVAAALVTLTVLEVWGFSIPNDVYYIDSLPVHLEVTDLVFVILAAFLIIWDFAVFPALKGSRLAPVEGLRDA